MPPLLRVSHLTKKFGGLTAVEDFNLEIKPGELVGLIGPNGAGKTTVFNMLTGINKPTAGEIIFEGKKLNDLPPYEIAHLGIARTFQNIRLFTNLTVYENVKTACHQIADYGILDSVFRTAQFRKQETAINAAALQILKLVKLYDRKDEIARNLPYGHQRRLEIARALALRPKLLLLDEPAAGMNPQESAELSEFIDWLRKDFKLTILLIEHHMDVVMNICNRVIVLNFGKTIATGSPAEVQANPAVIEAYLGDEEASA
ncbi:MAG TPA: ABC transporter ATP-binding protein [Firmicutes bacterium]|nr:ABC transporter ATP-binding protein [Bacillota bacterium]